MKNITTIGGGTGHAELLKGLNGYTGPEDINVTALVTAFDDGGSTGELIRKLKVSPMGDARQCLAALSSHPQANKLNGRYPESEEVLAGHAVGNIVLAGLEDMYDGDFPRAIKAAATLLDVTGEVVPVALDKHTLVMEGAGEIIIGESAIENSFVPPDAKIYLEPEAEANPKALEAIRASDMVVIAPGKLHSSLLPAFSPKGIGEALRDTDALVVVVTNILNRVGQTEGWDVADYVSAIERHIGVRCVDLALYNSAPPSEQVRKANRVEGEGLPVGYDPDNLMFVGARLLANNTYIQDENDRLTRTRLRHDPRLLGEELMGILTRELTRQRRTKLVRV